MPASEHDRVESRRDGGRRPAVGARGAVRVPADFVDEYPDGDASSTEAFASLVRAGEALLAGIDRAVSETLGVRQPVFSALAVLDGAGEPLTPSQIAERVVVPSATMTATLDQQERRGWVRRVPNPDDRRSVLVEITDEGRAVADRMLPRIRAVEKSALSVLTDEERRNLVELLDRVLRHSAEIAADPVPGDGRRIRPERLA